MGDINITKEQAQSATPADAVVSFNHDKGMYEAVAPDGSCGAYGRTKEEALERLGGFTIVAALMSEPQGEA
jgi:hypothetical protein